MFMQGSTVLENCAPHFLDVPSLYLAHIADKKEEKKNCLNFLQTMGCDFVIIYNNLRQIKMLHLTQVFDFK